MSAEEVHPEGIWMTMGDAMAVLKQAKLLPEEATAFVHRHLAAGALLARADTIRTEYFNGEEITHSQWEVPAAVWGYCRLPPLGHLFWISGDVQFQPPRKMDALSLSPIPPTITILGARVSAEGLAALVRTIAGARGRGRRKGAGSLAEADGPLVLEMHALVSSRAVPSVYQAAARLAKGAKGGGTEESKAKRLIILYRKRFPTR
jgi:hypothetical protein